MELDEELHFNRYRATTLEASWEADLPWTADYRRHCADHEPGCLEAGAWGKRWVNDSTAPMFCGGLPGHLDGDGAPRWKQRALYDAVKDAVASVPGGPRLVRLAVHDEIGGVSLGAALEGRGGVAPGDLRAVVEERTA